MARSCHRNVARLTYTNPMTTPIQGDDWRNKLYFGDNLPIMREHIPDESVDLIYLDPPFNSNATYNVLFRERDSSRSVAQIQAFDDTWRWGIEAARQYEEVVTNGPERLANMLQAMRRFLGQNDMMAYLTMMAPRMVEMHRVLKPTGSIYLHCDPTASHYLKLLMDAVFGSRNYRNEITWQRTESHNTAGKYGNIADILMFYSKSDSFTWKGGFHTYAGGEQRYSDQQMSRFRHVDDAGRRYRLDDLTAPRPDSDSGKFEWRGTTPGPTRGWGYRLEQLEQWWTEGRIHTKRDGTPRMDGLKVYLDEAEGKALQNIWTDIPRVSNTSAERLGYPTQKPEALLERIVSASSNEGDIVLDPFCGCGTAVAVAEGLNRRWIGIDITHLAISLMRYRLRNKFKEDLSEYDVIGSPADVESARALAVEGGSDGRYQFEYWALGLVEARPAGDRKRGADAGIDGYINFFDDDSGMARTVIVQVKSGRVGSNVIRDLRGTMEREQAEMAILITLENPTQPMIQESLAAEFYVPRAYPNLRFPRVQIATIEDILNGNGPEIPNGLGASESPTFRRAPRYRRTQGRSERMM